MNNIKIKATWHIIIDKNFTKERNINGYISFDPIIKVLIHIPYFKYIVYNDVKDLNRTITEAFVKDKTFGFYITDLNKLEATLSNGLNMLVKDFHINIDKSLNYTRIKNLYIETYLRGYRVDTRIDEEIIIPEDYIKANKLKGNIKHAD